MKDTEMNQTETHTPFTLPHLHHLNQLDSYESSLQHALSVDQDSSLSLWDSYDRYCEQVTPISWSTLDQKRLISMDYLSIRVFELHRMDHTFRYSHLINISQYMGELISTDYVLDYLVFTGNR